MADSIRTEIGIGAPGNCPIADASAATDSVVSDVSRSAAQNGGGSMTEEFSTDADAAFDDGSVENVFTVDTHSVYRFERERDRGCVCDRIERYGCPVSEIQARDGTLFVSFYAHDVETVRAVVSELDEWFGDVGVRQLTRSDEAGTNGDFVFVDRDRLTDRQREVLETAYEMGYFAHPKRANAGEVADAIGIAPSTFSEHLSAAQRKLFDALLQS